jgi:hypothetical protein
MIGNAVTQVRNVVALALVSGTTPDSSESAADLTARFPVSTLGDKVTRCRSPTLIRTSNCSGTTIPSRLIYGSLEAHSAGCPGFMAKAPAQ